MLCRELLHKTHKNKIRYNFLVAIANFFFFFVKPNAIAGTYDLLTSSLKKSILFNSVWPHMAAKTVCLFPKMERDSLLDPSS